MSRIKAAHSAPVSGGPSKLATSLLATAMLLCQFAFAIEQVLGLKVAYPVALAMLAVLAIRYGRFSVKLAYAAALAALVLGQVCLQAQLGVSLATGWAAVTALYTLFPVLVMTIDLRRINIRAVWWVLALTSIPSIMGLLLQVAGVQGDLLTEDFTTTLGEVVVRYSSIYGGSLLFGMCGFVQLACICSLYPAERRRAIRIVLVVLAGLAMACMMLSYARRAYLATIVAAAMTLGAAVIRRRRHKFKPTTLLVGLLVVAWAGTTVLTSESIRSRVLSSLAFSEDEGNALRAAKWLLAVNFIESNPLLGGGPGVLSAVGKTREDLGTAEDVEVAEMLFLTIWTDLGLIVGTIVIMVLIKVAMDRLLVSEDQRLVTGPLVAEGFAGTAILSPFLLLFFLLALSKSREAPVRRGIAANDDPERSVPEQRLAEKPA